MGGSQGMENGCFGGVLSAVVAARCVLGVLGVYLEYMALAWGYFVMGDGLSVAASLSEWC